MRCPHCLSMDDRVIDSRTLANGESIRRRRECLSCGFRFTSYERIEEKPLMVVKRDNGANPLIRPSSSAAYSAPSRSAPFPR
jgi:transcriptional repressor NrdR